MLPPPTWEANLGRVVPQGGCTAARVASVAERGEPTLVEGGRPIAIHVFGSDGGGGRFALGVSDGAVYYRPSSVSDFLDRLKTDIEAFVRGDRNHEYMAR